VTDGVSLARPTSAVQPRSRGGAHAARGQARPASARELAVAGCVCAIIVTAVPLALFQIPNGAAWLSTAPADPIGLLRACGMALPAIMMAAPCGAVAVRRAGTGWPVLLAGLLTIALADLAGGAVRSLPLVAVDRALHGIGAGLTLPGAAALAVSTRRARGCTGVIWVLVTVTALAAGPALVRRQVAAGTAGGWHAMLEPFPWLAGVALASVAAYLPLAGRDTLHRRHDAEDRARLAMLGAPLAALGLMLLAVSYRDHAAVIATAISEVTVLIVLIGVVTRGGHATRTGALPAAAALAGFTLMPFGTILPVAALAALALACGVVLAVTGRRAAMSQPCPSMGSYESATPFGSMLVAVVVMVAAVGAGYLWLTVHG
jgi:hypothetical protein